MKHDRSDGIRLLVLGIIAFLLLGYTMLLINDHVDDFLGVYLGTRVLLTHQDPFNSNVMYRAYLADGGSAPTHPQERINLQIITEQVYPPTTYLYIAPLAMLNWKAARLLWTGITSLALILATVLIWLMAADYAPTLAGFLAAILLSNCLVLFAGGNPAGVVIGLCVVAVWCFQKQRLEWVGVICLAVSLTIKPHDSGLVWLYLLLAGGVKRKRALQALAFGVLMAVPSILWVNAVAPNWTEGARTNLAVLSRHGGLNEPGPETVTGRSAAPVIDLQAAIATFDNHPFVYNTISYLVFIGILLLWLKKTITSDHSPRQTWLALAVVSSLTMLPIYHRPYDAKLLLLSIPACVMLWAEGRRKRWPALLFTVSAIVFTSDIPLSIFSLLGRSIPSGSGTGGKILLLLTTQPAPLSLLAMALFYLWVYLREANEVVSPAETPRQA